MRKHCERGNEPIGCCFVYLWSLSSLLNEERWERLNRRRHLSLKLQKMAPIVWPYLIGLPFFPFQLLLNWYLEWLNEWLNKGCTSLRKEGRKQPCIFRSMNKMVKNKIILCDPYWNALWGEGGVCWRVGGDGELRGDGLNWYWEEAAFLQLKGKSATNIWKSHFDNVCRRNIARNSNRRWKLCIKWICRERKRKRESISISHMWKQNMQDRYFFDIVAPSSGPIAC